MKANKNIKDLIQRIETLEQANEVTQHNFAFIRELSNIVLEIKELSVGRLVMNRAINRQKLQYLKHIVLPRRQKQLVEIHQLKMPPSIRKDYVNDELSLIKSATRKIIHRENYEKDAAQKVQSFFSRLLTKSPSQKLIHHQQEG